MAWQRYDTNWQRLGRYYGQMVQEVISPLHVKRKRRCNQQEGKWSTADIDTVVEGMASNKNRQGMQQLYPSLPQ
jgi:hypothetical protein